MRILLCVLAFSFVSCAQKTVMMDSGSAEMAVTAAGSPQREIIKAATQRVEVKDLKVANQTIQETTTKLGGYVEESNLSEEKTARFEIRVPSANLDQALEAMAGLGKEEYREVSAVDVTGQSVDLEAQLKNSKTMRDRLQQLIAKATAVKDILEIETQLQRVQTEIDSLEGRLKLLKNQVALSKISLTLERERQLGPLGYVFYGVGWVVEKLFVLN